MPIIPKTPGSTVAQKVTRKTARKSKKEAEQERAARKQPKVLPNLPSGMGPKTPTKTPEKVLKSVPKPTVNTSKLANSKAFQKKLDFAINSIEIDTDDLDDDMLDTWDDFDEELRPKLAKKNWLLWALIFSPVILPGITKGMRTEPTVRQPKVIIKGKEQSIIPPVEPRKVVDYAQKYFEEHGLELCKSLTETDLNRIKGDLKTNWNKGPDAFKEAFKESYPVSKSRLEAIYRSERHIAEYNGVLERAKHAGHEYKRWETVGDERTCDVCLAMDGEFAPLSEPFSNGQFIPSAHVNCRCSATTYTEDEYDELPDEYIRQDAAYLSDVADQMKLNYNCPDSEKNGTGPGSCSTKSTPEKATSIPPEKIKSFSDKNLKTINRTIGSYPNKFLGRLPVIDDNGDKITYTNITFSGNTLCTVPNGYEDTGNQIAYKKSLLPGKLSKINASFAVSPNKQMAMGSKGGFADANYKNNSIVFYASIDGKIPKNIPIGIIAHELAHCFDKNAKLSFSDEYKKAVQSDNESISDYADRHSAKFTAHSKQKLSEDFADAVRDLVDNPDHFDKVFPNRSKYIRKILGISDQKQDASYLNNVADFIKLNYRCEENPPGSGNFKCPDKDEDLSNFSLGSTTKPRSKDPARLATINLPRIPKDTSSRISERVKSLVSKEPLLQKFTLNVKSSDLRERLSEQESKTAYAIHDGSSITLNELYFGNEKAFREILDNQVQSGWHPKGCNTPESVVTHEVGHFLMEGMDNAADERLDRINEVIQEAARTGELAKISRYADSAFKQGDIKAAQAELFMSVHHTPKSDQMSAVKKVAEILRSSNHIEIIDNYREKGYQHINQYLRTGKSDINESEIKDQIKGIDALMKPLNQDQIIYRGVNKDFVQPILIKSGILKDLSDSFSANWNVPNTIVKNAAPDGNTWKEYLTSKLSGISIPEKGFSSTSKNPNAVEMFVKGRPGNTKAEELPAKLNLVVKSGTNAIDLLQVAPIDEVVQGQGYLSSSQILKQEEEILLDRNISIKIVSADLKVNSDDVAYLDINAEIYSSRDKRANQKQNSALTEVADFFKLNLKCKKGTVDESNKCFLDKTLSNINPKTLPVIKKSFGNLTDKFQEVKIDSGANVLFSPGNISRANGLSIQLSKLPKPLRDISSKYTFVFTTKPDPQEELRRRGFMNTGHLEYIGSSVAATADASSKTLISYRSYAFKDDILKHELAHAFYNTIGIQNAKNYISAMKSDGNYVSEYAKSSSDMYEQNFQPGSHLEDFADAIVKYYNNRESFEKLYPSRTQVLDTIFNNNSISKDQKQDSSYLNEVTEFLKLNKKCKAGTYDESNKCGPEKENKTELANFQEVSTSFNAELGGFHTTDYKSVGDKPLRVISQEKEHNPKLLEAIKDLPGEQLPSQFLVMKMKDGVKAKYYTKTDSIGVDKSLTADEMAIEIRKALGTMKRNERYLEDVATFIKLNYNCPASEKNGTGPGSCSGGRQDSNNNEDQKLFDNIKPDKYGSISGSIAKIKEHYVERSTSWKPSDSYMDNLEQSNKVITKDPKNSEILSQYVHASKFINESLRDKKNIENIEYRNQLNNLIDKSPLRQDVVLYRGITPEALDKYFPKNKNTTYAETGGFASFSGSEDIAKAYSIALSRDMLSGKELFPGKNPIIVELHAKQGTPGLFVENYEKQQTFDDDIPPLHEVIFKTDQQYKLLDIKKEKYYTKYIVESITGMKRNASYLDEVSDFIKLNYGTSEGARKAWDARGRGRKEEIKPVKFDVIKSATYQNFREKIDAGQKPDFVDTKTGEDNILKSIITEVKFNGLPKIKPGKDISKLVKDGHIELFRGVAKPEHTEQFKSGEYFAGQGIYGSGIYTGVGKRGIRTAGGYTSNQDNCIIRMVLDKDAKIITEKELSKKMDEVLSKSEIKPDGLRNRIINDPGRWAAMNGYDAIHAEQREYMIVLNRSKLTVQKEPINNDQYYVMDNLASRINALQTKKNEIDELDIEFPDDKITPEKLVQKQKLISETKNRIKTMESEITKLEKELNW